MTRIIAFHEQTTVAFFTILYMQCCNSCQVDPRPTVDPPRSHVFSNRSVKQCEDILANTVAANTYVIARKTQIAQCATVNRWGDILKNTLVGNYVLAV